MCLQGLCRSGGFRPLGSQWSWGWTLANQHHRRDISVDVLLMRHRLWFPMLPGKDAFKWGRVLVHSLSPCHPAQGTLRVWRGPEELGVRGGHTQGHPASPHPRYCPLPIRPITGCHSPFRADVLGLQRRPCSGAEQCRHNTCWRPSREPRARPGHLKQGSQWADPGSEFGQVLNLICSHL